MYGADGTMMCWGAAPPVVEGFYPGGYPTPQDRIEDDISYSETAMSTATTERNASASAGVRANTVAGLATNAASAQRADWGVVQSLATTSMARTRNQAVAQMAGEQEFVRDQQAADNRFSP